MADGNDGPKRFTCFNCNGEGHMARECPSKRTSPTQGGRASGNTWRKPYVNTVNNGGLDRELVSKWIQLEILRRKDEEERRREEAERRRKEEEAH